MDGEELGGTYVIAVEELGLNGLWSTIKDVSVQLVLQQALEPQDFYLVFKVHAAR